MRKHDCGTAWWTLLTVICATVLLLSIACGGGDGRITGSESTPEPAPTVTPDTRTLPEPVRLVRDRAAEDAGTTPEQVEIVAYTEERWPSTALGCPQPGKFYTQVITPGYRVLLRISDDTVTYHTDMDGSATQCER